MARANVNLADVMSFQYSIDYELNELMNTYTNYTQQLSNTCDQIEVEIGKMENISSECQNYLSEITSKISTLNSNLDRANARLANTDPVIREDVYDSEGRYIRTDERPNPEYQELQSEISSLKSQIKEYEHAEKQFRQLKNEAEHQISLLQNARSNISNIEGELYNYFNDIKNNSENAIYKLKNIGNAIQEYLDVKIETPSFYGNYGSRRFNPSSIDTNTSMEAKKKNDLGEKNSSSKSFEKKQNNKNRSINFDDKYFCLLNGSKLDFFLKIVKRAIKENDIENYDDEDIDISEYIAKNIFLFIRKKGVTEEIIDEIFINFYKYCLKYLPDGTVLTKHIYVCSKIHLLYFIIAYTDYVFKENELENILLER